MKHVKQTHSGKTRCQSDVWKEGKALLYQQPKYDT